MSENILELNRFEKAAMGLYLRFGAVGLIVISTLFSVIASIFAAVPLITMVGGEATLEQMNDPMFYIHIVVAVPLLVAPLCTFVFTCLLKRLNNAYKKVTELSTTDPLTGSSNRRGFMDAASNNIHTLQEAEACMVGMVDLDKFKLVNDTYGHQVGDQALMCVAKSLDNEISKLGQVGRLGGDEFAFIAFGNSYELDMLRERVSLNCTKLKIDNNIDISCSIGMVILEEAESIENALARADGVLYELKKGRPSSSSSSSSGTSPINPSTDESSWDDSFDDAKAA